MVCKKCRGIGRDKAAPAVKVNLPGQQRCKLMQPLCPACGGTGKEIQEDDDAAA